MRKQQSVFVLSVTLFCVLLLLSAVTTSAADLIVRSERLPETTPWDLKQLSEVTAV